MKWHNYNTPTENLWTLALNLEPISLGVIKNPGQLENRHSRCGRQESCCRDRPIEGSSQSGSMNRRATHGIHLYQVLLDRVADEDVSHDLNHQL